MVGVWTFLALTGFAALICLGALLLHLFDDMEKP